MIKVLGNRAVVRRFEAPKTTSSLIEIVEFNPDPSIFGRILAVGNVPDVAIGDTVILRQYAGAMIEVDGEEAFVVSGDDLLAVVESV